MCSDQREQKYWHAHVVTDLKFSTIVALNACVGFRVTLMCIEMFMTPHFAIFYLLFSFKHFVAKYENVTFDIILLGICII